MASGFFARGASATAALSAAGLAAAAAATVLPSSSSSSRHSASALSSASRGGRAFVEPPSLTCDAVVVGGGVCGLSTARELARRGKRVVVLEREQVGSQFLASAVNCGHIDVITKLQSDDVDALVTEHAGAAAEVDAGTLSELLCAGSFAVYAALSKTHAIEFRKLGLLQTLANDEEWNHALLNYPRMVIEACGCNRAPRTGAVLGRRELRRLEPALNKELRGAVLFPACGTAHPAKATKALAVEARAAGVTILESTEVFAAALQHGKPSARWALAARALQHRTHVPDESDDDTQVVVVHADEVVVAAGGLTRDVVKLCDGSLDVPVVPVVGQMFGTVPTTEVPLEHLVASMESSLYWHSHEPTKPPRVTHERSSDEGPWGPRKTRHLYAKRTPEGRVIVGGDRRVHPAQRVGTAHELPRVEDDMHTSVHEHACELMPGLRNVAVERQWGGIMPFSVDGAPLIGAVSPDKAPGVYVCSGLGPSGFMRGPMAGRLLAELMLGTPGVATLLTSADPRRFESRGVGSDAGAGANH